MKALGIEINSKRVIYFVLEKRADGSLSSPPLKTKYLEIEDDHNNQEIQKFLGEVLDLFDEINPDKIAILARQTKGRFAASSVSFKLEGLMQCFEKVDIEFVTKPKLNAFYKKNEFNVETSNSYQENAAKVANYLLSKS